MLHFAEVRLFGLQVESARLQFRLLGGLARSLVQVFDESPLDVVGVPGKLEELLRHGLQPENVEVACDVLQVARAKGRAGPVWCALVNIHCLVDLQDGRDGVTRVAPWPSLEVF